MLRRPVNKAENIQYKTRTITVQPYIPPFVIKRWWYTLCMTMWLYDGIKSHSGRHHRNAAIPAIHVASIQEESLSTYIYKLSFYSWLFLTIFHHHHYRPTPSAPYLKIHPQITEVTFDCDSMSAKFRIFHLWYSNIHSMALWCGCQLVSNFEMSNTKGCAKTIHTAPSNMPRPTFLAPSP